MEFTATLTRIIETETETIGVISIIDKDGLTRYSAYTLELPFRNNMRSNSCIPTGIYKCKKWLSPRFGNTYIVDNVDNRGYILFHKGNTYRDTKGCIIVGDGFELCDINLNFELVNSSAAFVDFMLLGMNEFCLEIIEDINR